jgi:hypothetical protein
LPLGSLVELRYAIGGIGRRDGGERLDLQ